MKLILHQTHHPIGDFSGILHDIRKAWEVEGLHLFPEFYLTGYPLQDLCLHRPFIDCYLDFLRQLDEDIQLAPENSHTALLVGGPHYEFGPQGLPQTIENVIYLLRPGRGHHHSGHHSGPRSREKLYAKRLLPNYDIYDEKKYFTPGRENAIWEFQGKRIALQICEDMWGPQGGHHLTDPVLELAQSLAQSGEKIDLVANLSASPYHLGKEERRLERSRFVAQTLKAPFAYVNRVGGEDEVLFDGRSFVLDGQNILAQGKTFSTDLLQLDWPRFIGPSPSPPPTPTSEDRQPQFFEKENNTWDSLFKPQIDLSTRPPHLPSLKDKECGEILQALSFGLQEYGTKNSMEHFLVGLSGGIDSTVVLAIAYLSKRPGQKVQALFMPGQFSSHLSYKVAEQVCRNFGIKLQSLSIKFLHKVIKSAYTETFKRPLADIGDENIQSRLRGALLYAHSNQTGAMVLNTSNKSELAVGHSTLYGDSVGAVSVLGDIYKSEVYRLAKYINQVHGNLIPQEAITRPPSAELRENQEDRQILPPYERLDAILEGILSGQISLSQFVQWGFSEAEVKKVYDLYQKSEYKRFQFCPIIKVKAKSFGFGYRIPICKKK